MRTVFSFVLLLPTLFVSAQRIEKFYDYNWELSTPGSALYFSVSEKEGDLYHVTDYYIRQKTLQMDGYYSDSALDVEEGPFRYYYPGRNLKTKSFYKAGKLHGEYLGFHQNGMMSDSANYINGKQVGAAFRWHQDGAISDSTNLLKDGSGGSVSWNPDGSPAAAGYYGAGQKMRGKWQFFHANGKLSSKERYEDGLLVDKQYFNEQGEQETDTISTDRKATFPGGMKAWVKYLSKHAHFPSGFQIVNSDAVVVVVTATIDENGKIINVYLNAPFHPSFDAIALKAMRTAPNWLPAINHHRRIKTHINQPLTFLQEQ